MGATAAPATGAPTAEPVSFAGQTITIIVGYDPGGGFDATARLVAKYIGKHLPGNPQAIVQNMPGAASLVAATHLYNSAPKDGTVIATFNSQIATTQATGEPLQVDMRKFSWLGASFASTDVCVVRSDSAIKAFRDIVGAATPVKMSATSLSDNTGGTPAMLQATTGANFQIITGYKGSNDARLGVDRNEVTGICQSWESLRSSAQVTSKAVKVIVQNAAKRHPELPDVPLADEFTKDEAGKQLLRLYRAPREFDKPFAAPPGVPAARLKALRDALSATYADAEFVADAKKQKIDLAPLTAAQVEKLINDVLATPPDVIKRFKEILKL